MSRADCCTWVDDVVRGLDPTSKAILSKLAAVADDDDRAWMTVATLADRVGASERTIQSRLRALETGDEERPAYLRRTGEFYRYGTRDVPYYELLVDYDAVSEVLQARKSRKRAQAEVKAMGATVCTHSPPAADAVCTPMGATVCTPKREPTESQGSLTLTLSARAPDEVARKVLAAWPEEYQARSSVREIAAAIRRERKRGGDVERLVAACLAYASNRKAWGPDGGPMAPHKLIDSGRWETLAAADAPKGSARARTGFAVPEVFRAAFVLENGADGERWAVSYLDACGWREEDQTLLARTGIAEEWLRKRGYRVERQTAAGKVG